MAWKCQLLFLWITNGLQTYSNCNCKYSLQFTENFILNVIYLSFKPELIYKHNYSLQIVLFFLGHLFLCHSKSKDDHFQLACNSKIPHIPGFMLTVYPGAHSWMIHMSSYNETLQMTNIWIWSKCLWINPIIHPWLRWRKTFRPNWGTLAVLWAECQMNLV